MDNISRIDYEQWAIKCFWNNSLVMCLEHVQLGRLQDRLLAQLLNVIPDHISCTGVAREDQGMIDLTEVHV